ncbi:MAG: putative transposase [Candidatus Paceibacteria bacterium]
MNIPSDYLKYVNEPQSEGELENIRRSVEKQKPYGGDSWVVSTVSKYGLESTIRNGGRPKKENRS